MLSVSRGIGTALGCGPERFVDNVRRMQTDGRDAAKSLSARTEELCALLAEKLVRTAAPNQVRFLHLFLVALREYSLEPSIEFHCTLNHMQHITASPLSPFARTHLFRFCPRWPMRSPPPPRPSPPPPPHRCCTKHTCGSFPIIIL